MAWHKGIAVNRKKIKHRIVHVSVLIWKATITGNQSTGKNISTKCDNVLSNGHLVYTKNVLYHCEACSMNCTYKHIQKCP